MINIFLVEDHLIVREGMKSILSHEPDFNVIGEAANGEEALGKIRGGLDISVILTDMNMPELNGLELTERIHEEFPHIKVIILTMLEQESTLQQAFDCGASGYLIKTVARPELAFGIRHVADGNNYISSELGFRLLRSANLPADAGIKVELSSRETEILQLVAAGMTNNQIADKLFTSRRTVEGHRQKLLNKTHTKNTASLIRFAVAHELLAE